MSADERRSAQVPTFVPLMERPDFEFLPGEGTNAERARARVRRREPSPPEAAAPARGGADSRRGQPPAPGGGSSSKTRGKLGPQWHGGNKGKQRRTVRISAPPRTVTTAVSTSTRTITLAPRLSPLPM